ncbi:MAG: MATE family efflux transporter [Pseudomonadales bacterium]|nr:MATE family efflux transporter [Pseudomonadales bacterium]
MRDLTQGSVTKTIIAMALPVAAGMIFQTMYLLVDLYFVAALGDAAVAGVGAAGTLMFMIMAITQVLAVSAVALISQAVGSKQQEQANLVFNQSMLLAVLLGLVTLVGGYAFAGTFMGSIAADSAARAEGVTFLYWFIPGMALQFAMMGMASALRATGIVKPGMIVQMLTVLLNTLLAPVLIAGWGPGPALGVMGAGLASTISVSVGIVLLILYFVKLEKYVSFQWLQWKPDFHIWKRMVDIGLPAGGEMLLAFVYFAIVYWLIQDFGAASQAGFSIGGRIMQSIFMPTMAVAFAIGPIVGQNFGAHQHERVREAFHKGILLNSLVMLVVTVFVHIDPDLMIRVFTDEAEVIAVGGGFLKIISVNFVAQGIVFTCSGIFQGLGNTRPALMSSVFRLVIFMPIALLISRREGFAVNDIWYVSVLAVLIQAIMSYLLVRRELRLKLRRPPVPASHQTPAVQSE